MTEAAYGSWRSPITSDLIVSATIAVFEPRLAAGNIYWMEGRPLEGGRYVIVRRAPDGTTSDVNPAPFNARTRVHEYGGGDYVVASNGTVFFTNFADQRIHVAEPGDAPVALTSTEGHRYADLVLDETRNRLVCVREDHSIEGREAINTIAAIDLATGRETVLVEGNDFYSNPRLRSDGTKMCWLSWDHPNMPWDGTTLHVANLSAGGGVIDDTVVAGGEAESVFQPEWSPDDRLYFVSDRSGWWNLYRWQNGEIKALAPRDAEFGGPLWQFGATTYAFESAGRIICSYGELGSNHFARLDIESGELTDIAIPYSSAGSIRVADGKALFLAGSRTAPSALVLLDLSGGHSEVLKKSSNLQLDEGYLSVAEPIEFPTEGGLTAFGYFYAPKNKDFTAPDGEKPPLLVMSHGGPTSATGSSLSLRIQYWTSRGFAVLDVNYGGSTRLRPRLPRAPQRPLGHRRRGRLHQRRSLPRAARPRRRRPAGDHGRQRRRLHDSLRPHLPRRVQSRREPLWRRRPRSPGAGHPQVRVALPRQPHRPLPRARGPLQRPLADPPRRPTICPRRLLPGPRRPRSCRRTRPRRWSPRCEAKGVPVAYLAFEGEQHGFRRAENIKRSLDGELYFYSRIFGFDLADPVEPLEIFNL